MPDPTDEILDPMARLIFKAALNEDRAGELLGALFQGASATVDVDTGRLVIFPAELIAKATEEAGG